MTRRRRLLALLVASAAATSVPAPACAHGGTALLFDDAGPYRVQLDAARLTAPAGPALDYTAYLHQRATGFPEARAQVELVVDTGHRHLRRRAQRLSNTYEVVLPLPDTDAWRQWAVTVHIAGPAGTATTTYRPPRIQSGPPAALAPITAALLVVLSAGTVLIRRRRRRGSAPAGALGEADAARAEASGQL